MIHKFDKTDFDSKKALRNEIKNNPPQQSVAGLKDRVEKIEKVLGIK